MYNLDAADEDDCDELADAMMDCKVEEDDAPSRERPQNESSSAPSIALSGRSSAAESAKAVGKGDASSSVDGKWSKWV